MNPFRWAAALFNFGRQTQSYVPTRAQRIVYAQSTLAGMRISPDTALQSAAVWACVQILSKSVAQLPWRLMQRLGPHASRIVDQHPIDALLCQRPNLEMGAFTFRELLMGHALLWGNGYAEIERDAGGRPVRLWPIEPDRVLPRRRYDTNKLYYQVTNQTKGIAEIEPEDMFHLHGPSYDGITGYQTTAYAAQSIGLAMAIERFGASFFGNNGTPGGVIQNKRTNLSPEARDAMLDDFNTKHQGPDRAFKWFYLDGEMDAKPFPLEPEKGQFTQSAQQQVDQICRWFGVPPHKVAQLVRSTNNNIEHQGIEFVTDGILPWTARLEQEADYKLLGVPNRQRFYTRIDVRSLQRGDLAARTAFYTAMFNVGAFSPNVILEAEGMNPIGPDGDQRFVPVTSQRLDQVGIEKPDPNADADPGDDDGGEPEGGSEAGGDDAPGASDGTAS